MLGSQDPLLRDLPILSGAHTLYQISTSFLEEKSSMRLIEPLPIKPKAWAQACWGDYLEINAFPDPVMVEQKLKLTLYKATKEAVIAVREKDRLDAADMTFGMSTSASANHSCIKRST